MAPTVAESYQRPIKGWADSWRAWDTKNGGFWSCVKKGLEVMAVDATQCIKQAGKGDKPFFMYLAFNAPHDPR